MLNEGCTEGRATLVDGPEAELGLAESLKQIGQLFILTEADEEPPREPKIEDLQARSVERRRRRQRLCLFSILVLSQYLSRRSSDVELEIERVGRSIGHDGGELIFDPEL